MFQDNTLDNKLYYLFLINYIIFRCGFKKFAKNVTFFIKKRADFFQKN